ncbi:MAG TPA: hypothetical protein VGS07_33640 [Thermoanaerobaculia bacterium]|jgi:hypothetical protein|nr:hypothetical protein [Thermoanaerobaculia bacterium]
MRKTRPSKEDKIRLTVDLSKPFYNRLEQLERFVEAGSKASLIRQALQLYEYVAKRAAEGCDFRIVDKNGREEKVVLLDLS